MLAKLRSCNEFAIQPRTLVSTMMIRTWWAFRDLIMNSAADISTSLNLPQRYSTYNWNLLVYLTQSISARDTRYQSAVRIQEQSRIYLPRFSWFWDWRQEATSERPVVYEEESKVEGSRWSAACYLVSFAISAYTVTTHDQYRDERFCFVLNNVRPLLPLEMAFFESAGAGKGFHSPIF